MNTLDVLWLAWSWIGFGGGIAVAVLLCTDMLRSDISRPRATDVTWLSWAMVLAYLLHVCEEYSMHVVGGNFLLVETFIATGVSDRFGGIPLGFFPYVNIVYTWVALPIAAALSRKNPVVGLSGAGFILINGLTHLASCIAGRVSPIASPGSVTGIFVFLPFFIWVVYICRRKRLLPKKGLVIAVISGVLAHILLFSVYILNMLAGHTAAMLYVPFVCFSPLIISKLLCVRLLVPRS